MRGAGDGRRDGVVALAAHWQETESLLTATGIKRQDSRWDPAGRAAFLATVPLFGWLPPDTVRHVAGLFRPKRVRRGAFLFHAGAPAETLHLLAEGRMKVIRTTEDGQEIILRVIAPGEIFGSAGGWGAPAYPASAVALEDALVLQLPAREFATLLRTHPDFTLALVREIGSRLREAEERILELQTQRVERRIARVLLRLAHKTGVKTAAGTAIGLPLSRQDLAELAGTTLSTASRTLSAWEQRGLVAAGRERVTIRDPHGLVALAEDLPPDESGGER